MGHYDRDNEPYFDPDKHRDERITELCIRVNELSHAVEALRNTIDKLKADKAPHVIVKEEPDTKPRSKKHKITKV